MATDSSSQPEDDRENPTRVNETFSLAAHQMKTPLAAIKGAVDLLVEDIGSMSREQADLVRMIRRNASRSIRMVSHILELSRLEQSQFVPRISVLTPLEIWREALVLTPEAEVAARGVTFEIIETGPNSDFRGDRERTVEILGFLIENAMRFADAKTPVELTWSCGAMGVSFTISDSGPGIPEDECSEIFRPFFRRHRGDEIQFVGDGLGLAVAQAIAKTLGGTVTYRTSASGGSTFELTLPALSRT